MHYYASYRGSDGKSKRKRFTRDRTESDIAYHRWVVENYDQSPRIIASDYDADKANFDQSFPVFANAYIQHEKQRVRSEEARRAKGTISIFAMPHLAADAATQQRFFSSPKFYSEAQH
jgi:hypothetical protein